MSFKSAQAHLLFTVVSNFLIYEVISNCFVRSILNRLIAIIVAINPPYFGTISMIHKNRFLLLACAFNSPPKSY